MKVIEGTVAEIVEYERLVGRGEGPGSKQEAPEEEGEARVARQAGEAEDDEAWYAIEQHVFGRARSAASKDLVLDYLSRAVKLGTLVEVGESQRTHDGLTDYIMVRDDGPRRFGAVAYVRPRNAGLTLRLGSADIQDVPAGSVQLRQTKPGNQYAVNCPLVTPEAVELALRLTSRALDKVR